MVVVVIIVVLVVLIVLAGLALRRADTATVTFPAPVRAVDIKLPAGGVRLSASADGDGGVAVTREMRWLLAKPKLDERLDDGTLHLHVTGSPLLSGIVEYSLTVPAGADVTVWTSAGTIHATGIDGRLDARSSAGGIYVEGGRGPLTLRTSAGSVEGERLGSTDVEVHTSAGGVDLTFVVPPERVEIETAAGSVDVVVPEGAYAVDADSAAGAKTIDVGADGTSGRRITARTSAGSIRITHG